MKHKLSFFIWSCTLASLLAAPATLFQNDFETDSPELCDLVIQNSGRPNLNEETFRITDKDAHSGRKSIQLSPVPGSDILTLHMDMFKSLGTWTGLEMNPEKNHTVSAWVKANVPDTTVTIRFNYKQGKTYKIGTEWQRIEFSGKPLSRKELAWNGNYTEIMVSGIGRKVLIDSVKVEVGEKATPFIPGAPTLDPRCNIKFGGKGELPKNTPNITIPKITDPVFLDGMPDEKAWSGIKSHLISSPKAGNAGRTEFKIATDGMFLYFAFKCYEPDMKNIRTEEKKHDGAVWNDESVEVMLKPNIRTPEYYQYVVNANGVSAELQPQKKGVAWNGTWEVKTRKASDHWTAEIKIPAFSVSECGAPGSPWLCNVARSRVGKITERLPWSGTEYHDLQSYAVLHNAPEMIRLSILKKVEERIDKDFFVIRYTFENTSEKTLNWAFQSQTGKEKKNRSPLIPVPAGAEKAFEIKLPLKKIPEDFIVVAMLVGEKGRTLASDYRHFQIRKLMEGPMLRHQICLQKDSKLEYRMNFPRIYNQNNAVLCITLTHENGKEVYRAEKEFRQTAVDGTIPLEKIPFGKYIFKTEILKNGESVVSRSLSMRYLPDSGEESVVRTDRFKRVLTYNGKAMIGLGTWLSTCGPIENKALEYPLTDGMKQGVRFTWAPDWGKMFREEELLHFLDLCQKNNLKAFVFWKLCFNAYPCGFCKSGVCFHQENGSGKKTDLDPEKMEYNLRLLKKVRKHPAFLGNYIIDEPSTGNLEKVKTVVNRFKEEDPYHPSFAMLNNSAAVRVFEPYMNEIVMLDDYNRNHGAIYYNSKEVRSYAPYRAMWYYITSMSGAAIRKAIVPEELRNMAYQVIVNGGSSIWPFSYKPWNNLLWKEWKNMAIELKTLEPAIACEDFSDLESNGVGISFRNTKDALYILTVSLTESDKNVIIPLPERWKNAKHAEVLFENRTLELQNGTLCDHYGEYTRHVYKIMK